MEDTPSNQIILKSHSNKALSMAAAWHSESPIILIWDVRLREAQNDVYKQSQYGECLTDLWELLRKR